MLDHDGGEGPPAAATPLGSPLARAWQWHGEVKSGAKAWAVSAWPTDMAGYDGLGRRWRRDEARLSTGKARPVQGLGGGAEQVGGGLRGEGSGSTLAKPRRDSVEHPPVVTAE